MHETFPIARLCKLLPPDFNSDPSAHRGSNPDLCPLILFQIRPVGPIVPGVGKNHRIVFPQFRNGISARRPFEEGLLAPNKAARNDTRVDSVTATAWNEVSDINQVRFGLRPRMIVNMSPKATPAPPATTFCRKKTKSTNRDRKVLRRIITRKKLL